MLNHRFIISGVSVDGQYVVAPFINALHKELGVGSGIYDIPVSWDPCHLLNLVVTDIKDGKIGSSKEYLARFINRSNLFCHLMGRGKNHNILLAVAEKNKLTLKMPLMYAPQR